MPDSTRLVDGKPEALRVVLVATPSLSDSETEVQASLRELENLAAGLGYRVTERFVQRRPSGSSMLLGKGKLKELEKLTGGGKKPTDKRPSKARARWLEAARKAEAAPEPDADAEGDDENEDERADNVEDGDAETRREVDIVIVDAELDGGQLRHLEQTLGVPVLDRTGVILRVFEERARTRQARLQVELARLSYEASRIRSGGRISDARGGGGRGERGHTNVELAKQANRERSVELRRELEALQRVQKTERQRRRQALRVALVGYTNAGKSSLMRALTGSQVLVADKLFATLDTTVRALQPESVPRILVSDTIGFLRNLPHALLASFRSTLEEANEAGLLLLVLDASDPELDRHLQVTREVLAEIGAGEVPTKIVLNKLDRLTAAEQEALFARFPDALGSSAFDPAATRALRDAIEQFFDGTLASAEIELPYSQGKLLGELRASARIVSERYTDTGITLGLRAPPELIARLLGSGFRPPPKPGSVPECPPD